MSFKIFMDSIEGPYHRKNNVPNQDSVAHVTDGDSWIMGGVADGAGSLSLSHIGSFDALAAAKEAMIEVRFDRTLLEQVQLGVEKARETLLAKEDYKEYGSTIALVVMDNEGNWATGAVGDSFSVIHLEDKHELHTGPSVGEYANITQLLTSSKITPTYAKGQGAIGFSISSDGLERISLTANKAHPGFWDGIVKKALDDDLDIARMFEWLESLDRIEDDTTLLTVVNK